MDQKSTGLGACALVWKGLETCDQFNHSGMPKQGILRAIGYHIECISRIKILERLVGTHVQGPVPLNGNTVRILVENINIMI